MREYGSNGVKEAEKYIETDGTDDSDGTSE